jgi:hypothetical protein
MDPLDAIAGQVGEAEAPGEAGTYLDPGEYLLFVDVLKTTKKWDGANIAIGSFDILESSCPGRPAGTRGDVAFNLTKQPKYAASDTRAMLAAIAGYDPTTDITKMDGAKVKKMFGPENPAHGRLVRCTAVQRNNKDKDGVYTVYRWKPAEAELQKQAAALREKAGFSPF